MSASAADAPADAGADPSDGLPALNIPAGVTPELVQDIRRIQKQILVLIDNHHILNKRARRYPEESVSLQKKICAVERFMLQFNEEQKPLLARLRREVSEKGLKVEPLPQHQQQQQSVGDDDPEGAARAKAAARAAAIRQRMAQVRDSKKKRGKVTKRKAGHSSQRPTRTPTPDKDGEWSTSASATSLTLGPEGETPEERRRRQEEEANGGLPLVAEGQVRAHLDDAPHAKTYDAPIEPVREEDLPNFPFGLKNILFNEAGTEEKINYMRHLDLMTEDDLKQVDDYRQTVRSKTFEYRNLTYIPEFNDKKQRLGYSWLSTDQLSSPPLLRNRSNASTRSGVGAGAKKKSSNRIGGLDAANIQQLMLDRPRTRRRKVVMESAAAALKGRRSNSNSRASTPVPAAASAATSSGYSTRRGGAVAAVAAAAQAAKEEDDEEEEDGLVDAIENVAEDDDNSASNASNASNVSNTEGDIDANDEDEDEDEPMEEDDDATSKISSSVVPDDVEEDEDEEEDEEERVVQQRRPLTAIRDALEDEGDDVDVVDGEVLSPRQDAPFCPPAAALAEVDDAVVAALPGQDEQEEEEVESPVVRQQQQQQQQTSQTRRRKDFVNDKQRTKLIKSKIVLEQQLQLAEARRRELAALLDVKGSKFTVATRKERTRRNEMELERSALEVKVAEFKAEIEECEGKLSLLL